jgi:hypothetical protein
MRSATRPPYGEVAAPEVPFWPQLPRLSEWESVIGQGLDIVADLLEPRNEGYGYQIKEGRIAGMT